MKTFVLTTLQKAFHRYLSLDPASEDRLAALEGRRVSLTLGKAIVFYIVFSDRKISFLSEIEGSPDTIIKGNPLSLFRMTLTKGNRKSFFEDDVSIEGNMDVGQQVIALFDELEIDWEEWFSHWVGDVPSYHVGRAVRSLKRFNKTLSEAMWTNVNEYVHEEINFFPSREALMDFFNDVDHLRMALDRLESRIERLEKALHS